MISTMRFTTSLATALAASILAVGGAYAAPLLMTIDHNASSLTLNGKLSGFTFVEQSPGSKTTKYTGTITVDLDNKLAPSTLSILSAAADADVNGSWLPKLGGQNPSATDPDPTPAAVADYGIKAQFGANDAAYAAVRGLVLNVTSGAEAVGGGGLFNSSETLTVLSGLFDSWVTPLLGGGGGQSDSTGDVYPRDATLPTQSSYVVVGNLATLTIPVNAKRIDDGDFTSFTGTLVATAIVPEPSTFLLLGMATMCAAGVRRRK